MSRLMNTFLSLQQFLEGTKKAFLNGAKNQGPVKLVLGNEAADLDSFASSILYAYLYTMVTAPRLHKQEPVHDPVDEREAFFKRLPTPTLPILSIPRSELSLRPEHAHLISSHLSFTLDDVPTLDEIPDTLSSELNTSITLVDHNVLQHSLASKFSSRVTGIIDHHADEGKYTNANPRTITPCGSCVSLVTNHFRNYYPTHWENIPPTVHSEIARLALAPLLIDTANLTSKVTPIDVVQVTELLERAGEGFNREAFYDDLVAAKTDLSALSVDGLLRKDYKQWVGDNGITLGISAITNSLSSVVKKAGGIEAFTNELTAYAKDKQVDVAVVMTTDSSISGFRRDLLIWGVNDRTRSFADQFEKNMNEKFKLEQWPNAEDELAENFQHDGMKAWTQASLDLSRKQVAPVLRDIANKL
ncbi:hypothetical protein H072_8578 [Dactylellina haptotyla CBS 200.50]|uniref:DHHA2 domain-containing protein n=1 Tax=Dactylellina haptotyla (strain CBS 200.50) TaxID=1284197 RepID=S8BR12_DACHA|nr:hypothetical protein H072_8578 [Dactylellina haptotyla CBS 200.50]